MDVRIASNGRLILPRQAREAMGLSGDTKVSLEIEGDMVRLSPLSHRVRRAREMYRDAITAPRTTEDFLRDRRAEADLEEDRVKGRTNDGAGHDVGTNVAKGSE
ncbi:AbrB/MazE/SpoVT family DNA-binding domain-containing protein [uncultured Jannaschia sp.]|uniref:AbrB/MazE/SpoVT family DNA-binding domain-containing protein n=1 Tax=uncultured Jannaschia sp. TaxID=293347 RepID=UPI00261CFFAD|nr:AbrB/MazE/SpoVT family DNA-binding domain-containing protein [uncultured Jannaschia sp.]